MNCNLHRQADANVDADTDVIMSAPRLLSVRQIPLTSSAQLQTDADMLPPDVDWPCSDVPTPCAAFGIDANVCFSLPTDPVTDEATPGTGVSCARSTHTARPRAAAACHIRTVLAERTSHTGEIFSGSGHRRSGHRHLARRGARICRAMDLTMATRGPAVCAHEFVTNGNRIGCTNEPLLWVGGSHGLMPPFGG